MRGKHQNMTKAEYASKDTVEQTTIHHFHEKLLKLKGKMNTEAGRRLAEHRHRFMEEFLDEFHQVRGAAQPQSSPPSSQLFLQTRCNRSRQGVVYTIEQKKNTTFATTAITRAQEWNGKR